MLEEVAPTPRPGGAGGGLMSMNRFAGGIAVEDEDEEHSTSEEKRIGHCCCSRTTSSYILLCHRYVCVHALRNFIEQCVSNPYNTRYQLRGRRMKSRTKRGIVAT
jgi:hypothetical protein